MKKLLNRKNDVVAWLKDYHVRNYNLIEDAQFGFIVDVDWDLDLSSKNLDSIDVKFNRVQNNFTCFDNNLASLLGCPNYVGGSIDLDQNLLTSLEHAPRPGKHFFCSNNRLTNLRYCPQNIPGSFFCNQNNLTNLEHFPLYVGLFVHLRDNPKLEAYQNMTDFQQISTLLEKSLIADSTTAQKKSRIIKL